MFLWLLYFVQLSLQLSFLKFKYSQTQWNPSICLHNFLKWWFVLQIKSTRDKSQGIQRIMFKVFDVLWI